MVGNADKRQHILDVATRLARTEGLRGLSVRSVAAEAGIGATTLRTYFPSQALLYRAVAERLAAHALSDDWIGDTSRTPADRLHASLSQFFPRMAQLRHALTVWFELLTLSVGPETNPEVLELVRSGYEQSASIVGRWFTRLAEDGCGLPEPPEVLAGRFLTIVDGLQLDLLLNPDEAALGRVEDTLRWFVKQALVTEAG
ncbi:TetR/AcrR family transcriptional regulator [Amycolatopsis sp. PS_44_ISF1]|uniref:TetR/AcrR family transcriptional regulator n=1 Tax=Amycolatopsis sp. PS_44_ISF1 TaxID=2974917 RepID=UPI0028DE185D|nr:TetR/AcrR family transcriptional regulator [Amycolatopsis sp. PS_44_ISF1]MDT8915455.1 TetR/AcrR family transcriptional regulator [Amycolatopsis sp. PS_44_ISF1]